jgi:dTDP-4-dehydrorhamnose 3,5-epimerase
MKIETTPIEGLLIIHPQVFSDHRGYFFETFNQKVFNEIASGFVFVQDNESASSINTLRGLHFQAPPFDQGKLVRVVKGKALDVAVDIRKSSPTYGKYVSVLLDDQQKTQFWIPPGFAHGFLALEKDTIFSYKCTNFYHKASEGCIRWNDPDLNIHWGVNDPIVSEKDAQGQLFRDFISPF